MIKPSSEMKGLHLKIFIIMIYVQFMEIIRRSWFLLFCDRKSIIVFLLCHKKKKKKLYGSIIVALTRLILRMALPWKEISTYSE